MTQGRFNALAILNSNQSLVAKLMLVKVASDFVNSHPNRSNDFGAFTEMDLKGKKKEKIKNDLLGKVSEMLTEVQRY